MSRGNTVANKRQRAGAAVSPDARAVVVKSDEMRPKLADFANFMDSLQEDRDALRLEVGELKETVDDLRANVERLEEETGDNEQLKKDAAYYKEDAAAKKLKADDMEMDNRSKTEEIKALQAGNVKLKSSLERSKDFIEESNEHLNEATDGGVGSSL